jgi:V-type H+-transporting ATPase subunit a
MPRESAWDVLNELGEKSCLEFIDQNPNDPAFGRPFSNILKRCEEIEVNLKQIEDLMRKFNVPVEKCHDCDEFLRNLSRQMTSRNKAESTLLEELEVDVESKGKAIMEQSMNYEAMQKKFITLVEYKAVLRKTREKLGDSYKARNAVMNPTLDFEKKEEEVEKQIDFVKEEDFKGSRLNYLAGILDREESQRFKRMVFRITKGNSWTYFEDVQLRANEEIKEEEEKDMPMKTVFIVVYQGGVLDLLKTKLNKLCESFGASK